MTEHELLERAKRMTTRISQFSLADPLRYTLAELRQASRWGPWSDSPGLYYFVHEGQVVYIGRATPGVCIGNRIGSHISDTRDATWVDIISQNETVVGIIPFPALDWHWVAALEVWLIDVDPRPQFNRRF